MKYSLKVPILWAVTMGGALHITDSDGNPNVFNVEHDDDGQYLNANYANPDNQWNADNVWVFGRNYAQFSCLRQEFLCILIVKAA